MWSTCKFHQFLVIRLLWDKFCKCCEMFTSVFLLILVYLIISICLQFVSTTCDSRNELWFTNDLQKIHRDKLFKGAKKFNSFILGLIHFNFVKAQVFKNMRTFLATRFFPLNFFSLSPTLLQINLIKSNPLIKRAENNSNKNFV